MTHENLRNKLDQEGLYSEAKKRIEEDFQKRKLLVKGMPEPIGDGYLEGYKEGIRFMKQIMHNKLYR